MAVHAGDLPGVLADQAADIVLDDAPGPVTWFGASPFHPLPEPAQPADATG
jgi:hypothetical protein